MTLDRVALAAGDAIESYKIVRVLGAGAFGITYLAHESNDSNLFAIKEYFPRSCAFRSSRGIIQRAESEQTLGFFDFGLAQFINEARVLARLNHPNIISVRRYFKASGSAYIVMDYCKGTPLSRVVDGTQDVASHRLRQIFFPLVDALEHLHRFGIFHRDIKPANIYINADGAPILLDFGAARLNLSVTNSFRFVEVTDGFAPPEQYASGCAVGPWSDIYSLGCTLYFSLVHRPPISATKRILFDEVPPLREQYFGHINPAVLELIDRCLSLEFSARPGSAKILKQELVLLDFLPDGFRVGCSNPSQPVSRISASGGPNRRQYFIYESGFRIFMWVFIVFLFFILFSLLTVGRGKEKTDGSPRGESQIQIE